MNYEGGIFQDSRRFLRLACRYIPENSSIIVICKLVLPAALRLCQLRNAF